MAKSKPQDTKGVHAVALDRFNRIWSASQEERDAAKTDRRFVGVTGAQWEGALGDQYANKVKIEVDRTSGAVERVDNEYRANRITVDFTPKNGASNDALSDVCDGLYRADEQNSGAQEAYDVAFNEGITGGYGGWRFVTDWEDDNDDENEHQRILIEPIYEADSTLFFDCNAKRQDKADSTHAFVLEAITVQSYIDEYDDDPASWPIDQTTVQFDWSTPDVVYVAEYYLTEKVNVELTVYKHVDGTEETFTADRFEQDEDLKASLKDKGSRKKRTRTVKRDQVSKYILSGNGILKGPEIIPGGNIPLVPYYGKRVFIDAQERCSGIVRRGKDVQRLKNMMLSKLAEQSAQSAYPKPIFASDQITPVIAAQWATANVDNPAYLQAEPVRNVDGSVSHVGPVGYTNPGEIPPATAALTSLVDTDIDAVLGNNKSAEEIKSNVSGAAIELVQDRLDQQSFKYVDNFRIAMKRGGQVWLGMAREIYVEDDRVMKTVGPQKEVGQVKLNAKILDSEGNTVSQGDLSRATFDVNAEVGPSSSSKRQAMIKTMGGVLQNSQDEQTRSIAEAVIMQNIPGEGMGDINEFYRKKLVTMGVYEPTEEDIKKMEEAAEGAAPNPNDEFLQSEAAKNMALAEKAQADTQQSIAKTGNLEADTATKIASIPRDDRQQVIDAVAEIDREDGRRQPSPAVQPGLSNGIPPGL
jgi:hypothetical protein